MAKVPVKLAKGEIVLPPRLAQKYRQRLEEMNKIGLQARAAGGVVNYMNQGGTANFLGQQVDPGAIGALGASLVGVGSGNFQAASDAWSNYAAGRNKKAEQGDIERKLAELDRLLATGTITQEQYDKMKADTLGGGKGNTEKRAIISLMDKAATAYSLVNPASAALAFVRERAEISQGQWVAIFAGAKAGGDPTKLIEALTGQIDLKLAKAGKSDPELAASEVAYQELKAYLTEMTTVALAAQGSGPKTDFDFIVAERSVANLYSSDQAIKNSMKRVVDSGVKTAQIEGWLDVTAPALVEGEKTEYTSTSSVEAASEPDAFDDEFDDSDLDEDITPVKKPKNELIDTGGDDGNTNTDTVDTGTDGSGDSDTDAEVPLQGQVVHVQSIRGNEYRFIELRKKEVPESVKDAVGRQKNRPYLAEDGYVYMLWDEGALSFAKWVKSNLKYKGG